MELLSTVDEDEQLSGSDTCEIFVPSVSVSDSKKEKNNAGRSQEILLLSVLLKFFVYLQGGL